MKKLILTLIFVIFLIGIVSADDWQWDNIKDFEKNSSMPYGRYLIKDAFGLGGTVAIVELMDNLGPSCGQYCSAQFEIQAIKDNIPLVDDIRFLTILDDGSKKEQPIRNYYFYYVEEKDITWEWIDDYEVICGETGQYNSNGTAIQSCSNVKVGQHKEYSYNWISYSLGQSMPKGKYIVKVEGEKKPTRAVDWQISSGGTSWTNEWAIWGTSGMNITGLISVHQFNNPISSISYIDSINQSFNLSSDSAGITSITGKNGNGIIADSSNTGHLTFANPPTYTGNVSISLWFNQINSTCGNGYNTALFWGSGATAVASNDSAIKFVCSGVNAQKIGILTGPTIWTNNVVSSSTYAFNTWHHVVIIGKTGSWEVYANGVNIVNASGAGLDALNYASMTNYLFDGSNNDVNERPTKNLKLDEVYIWNRVISQSEIDNLYNSGTGSFFGEGQITLNSPIDRYNSSTNNIQFNGTANVIGGGTLTNISLWTNSTGTWKLNQTVFNFTNLNLISYWELETGNGTFFVDKKGINNGTCSGASCPTNVSGIIGGAYKFDGVNDGIVLGDALDSYTSGASKKWTYSLWVKKNGIGTDDMLIAKWQSADPNREYQMYFNTANNIIFFSDSLGDYSANMYSTTTSTYTSTNNWYHVVFVWDSSLAAANRQSIYVNGTLQTTTVVGSITSIYDGIRNLTFGADSAGNAPFNGAIDEISFWNRGLSSSEISILYNSGIGSRSELASSSTETFNLTLSDGNTLWTYQACDSDGDCGFGENRTVNIDTTSPSIQIYYPSGNISGLTNGQTLNLNYTITDSNLQACWREYNGVNTTIGDCTLNTTFTYSAGINSIKIWANDTVGNIAYNTSSWNPNAIILNITFNSSTYETAQESFILNATNMTSASLIYNGTEYSASVSGNIATRSLTIPTSPGNKSFYWKLNGGAFNSSASYQNVNPLIFSLCNSTNNISYINFTFKDENALAYINASVSSLVWTYWLGDGSVNKTLVFSNATENPSYAFCLNAADRTLNNYYTIQYLGTGYPQRTFFNDDGLTNTTTNQTLYLLASTDGILVTFVTSSVVNQPISGVTIQIERLFGVGYIGIGQQTTDSAGSSTFWLNPLYSHRIIATKAGYASSTSTIVPTQPTYTIIMSSTTATASNYSSNVEGITYFVGIEGLGHFDGIKSNTNYTWFLNISSNKNNLQYYSIVLYTQNGTVLAIANGTEPSGEYLTLIYNSGVYSRIAARYYIDVGYGIVTLNAAYIEIDLNESEGEGSIKHALRFIKSLRVETGEATIADNQEIYSQLWWFFFLLFLVIGTFTYFTNIELVEPGKIFVTIYLLIIFIVSYMGFFEIPWILSLDSQTGETMIFSAFMKKYAFFMITFFLSIGYAIGRWRDT